jgi:hypothetical protein
MISTSVSTGTIYFVYSGANTCSVSSGNRRYVNTVGWTVNKMMRCKL